jgi:hypothetical protein
MADAALQELDSGFTDKMAWSGSAAAAEELFSEMLGAADSQEFLEARKEARRMPDLDPAAGMGQMGGAVGNGNGSNSDGSSNSRGSGSAANDSSGSSSSGSKGSRMAKQARVPVAASVAAGAEQQRGYRDVLLAAAGGSYNGYNTSPSESETDEGSASEVSDSEVESGPDSAAQSVAVEAAGNVMEAAGVKGEGNGNGRGKHGVLERLDLSFGWEQPDDRCEAATGG